MKIILNLINCYKLLWNAILNFCFEFYLLFAILWAPDKKKLIIDIMIAGRQKAISFLVVSWRQLSSTVINWEL